MAQYNNGNGSSLSDLERQAESTRAELAQTVDALHSRVSPDALKRDAKSYARQTGQQLFDTVQNRARENPLAAVAVAAGLALPLWRMMSNVPAPILLIGAGLAMSRRGSASSGSRYEGSQALSENSGPSLAERASNMAKSLGDKATDTIEDAQYSADQMKSRVTGAVSARLDSVREMASGAASAISETTADMSRHTVDGMERARNSFSETLERNPLLIGGLAFAVGGLIASSLPVTRTENRLMGSTSDDIKSRAKAIAEDGAEVLQTAASEAYDDIAAQTNARGLTPDTARGAVRTAMEQAGGMIDKAARAVEGPGGAGSMGARPTRKHKINTPESNNG